MSASLKLEKTLAKWRPETPAEMDCDDKVRCSSQNKVNKCDLNTAKFPITYGDFSISSHLHPLPRRYTSIHNDETEEIFLYIGHDYNQKFLDSEEVQIVQSQVVGEWVKRSKCKGYKIVLTVLVSTPQNPQAFIRNFIFCQELAPVLQGLALAEKALLLRHPEYAKVPIIIHFQSEVDPSYERYEKWGTLGYWACHTCAC